MTQAKYLQEPTTLTLTRKEMLDLGAVFSDADHSEVDFLKIKDKKIRRLFERTYKKRHKLWLKIQRVMRIYNISKN